MASVASAAATKCRTLVYCTHRLQGPSFSALRQHYVAPSLLSQQSKRSFHSIHEQGRRTKSTATTTTTSSDQQTTYDSDLVVVLDLDECLVHSKFLTRQNSSQHYTIQVNKPHEQTILSSFSEAGSPLVDTFHISLPGGDLARVHQRPHLQDFLQQVSSKYETHLFTAGKKVYAESVLEQLDPDGSIFTNCLFRDDCTFDPTMRAYVKDLDLHFDDLQKTVLVDNNQLSFLNNPDNGILVSNFFDDPNDTTLLAVLELLDELEQEEDVRPLLRAQFGLSDFLKRRQLHERKKLQLQQQQQSDRMMESEGLMINVSV
ncbi:unnamed protein product [Cylindrotheca closterium]|uniref:FCP1 homology domain-containing protein n=1 Tax=Cylindrotheca closterium TaxID=2856 RepID=A0AAD2G6G3_9STRA|nr:unnamed protein product [Cylindrotheca closterium]